MKTPLEQLLELRNQIKELLLKGDFIVNEVFTERGSYYYRLFVGEINLEIVINNRQISINNELVPHLTYEEQKIVSDFIMKGGIKQAIESCKQEIKRNTDHLKSLEDLYNNKNKEE